MTKTTNYQLPKWEKTDRIQMKDFNDMTATLDAALKANADAIAGCGNCRMSMLAYTGNGKHNDAENGSYITEINFTAIPAAYLIVGPHGMMIGRGGDAAALGLFNNINTGRGYIDEQPVTWSGAVLQLKSAIHPRYQMNETGCTYWILRFDRADQ